MGKPAVEHELHASDYGKYISEFCFHGSLRQKENKIKSHAKFTPMTFPHPRFFVYAVHVHIFEFVWRLRWTPVCIQSFFPLPLSSQHSDTAARQDGFSSRCICFFNALFSAAAPSDPSNSPDSVLWVIHSSWDQIPFHTLNCIPVSLCVLYSTMWFSRRLVQCSWQATSKYIKMYILCRAHGHHHEFISSSSVV